MQKVTLSEATATGEEIFALVAAIEPILENAPVSHCIMACLSIVLTLINPEATMVDVQAGIRDVSEYICLYMDGKGIQMQGGSPSGQPN